MPRDYHRQRDIEIVLAEMAEQVANRLRKAHKKTTVVSIHIGYSKNEMKRSIHTQRKIEATNLTKTLVNHVLSLFRQKYSSGSVRQIGVAYSGLVDETYRLLSLFEDVEQTEKEEQLQSTIDTIRERFGFLAIQKGTVLTDGSRNRERSQLIGGHSAGGLEGLK